MATARDALVRRGTFTLGPLILQVDAGDRIGITGPNGAGKTTLLRLLLERLEARPGVGRARRLGAVGEVDQARFTAGRVAHPAGGVRDAVARPGAGELRTLLAKFGLTAEHVMRPVSSLSPGEQTRAALALLQARGVNLLVLDEPTNHLDLPHRAARECPRGIHGHFAAGHPRPRMLEAVQLNRRWSVADGRVRED